MGRRRHKAGKAGHCTRLATASPVRRVCAALALVSLATPALASELTELQGPYVGDGPIAFRAGLDYHWRSKEVALLREFDCLSHEVVSGSSLCAAGSRIGLAKDLRATRLSSELDVDLRLAFYRAFEVRMRLPIVLSEETRIDYDDGIDGRNSITAPYNSPALLQVPYTNTRSGVGDPVVGLWGAILSSARDRDDPNLVVGFELGFPLAAVRTPGNTAVGGGAWAMTFAVAGSDRAFRWLEPFFRLAATLHVPASDALYPDLGATQATRGPPERVAARFGVEFIPFERPAEGSAVRIELGAELGLVTSGKSATELFDALGTSSCSPDGEAPCDLTTHSVGTRSPGTSIAEEHFTGAAWLGAHYDVLETLRLSARVNVGWESPHFLTSSNLGVDSDGRGVEDDNSLGQNEHDPDYNPHLDAPGTRFRTAEALLVGVDFSVVGRF